MQSLEVSGAVRLIYKSLGVKGLKYCTRWQFFLSLLQMKNHLLYLCHNYFRGLYETCTGTFLQQLMKVKGNEYFELSI